MTAPYWVGQAEGDALWVLGARYTWKALGRQTANEYSLCEVQGPAGFGVPTHFHSHENEGFLVGQGDVTLLLDGEEVALTAGAFGFAPAGVHHAFRLDSEDARLFLLITPGAAGHEEFFAAMGEPAGDGLPPAPTGPPDFDALGALAARHGTTVVGPPIGV
jgi:quercetin dioxygenase-like cupin family protein